MSVLYDLTEEWEKLLHHATKIYQKNTYSSSRHFNDSINRELISVSGEYMVQKFTAIPFDSVIRPNGQKGVADFPDQETDVKSRDWAVLKKMRSEGQTRYIALGKSLSYPYYICTATDCSTKEGCIIGWVSREEVEQKGFRTDFGKGYSSTAWVIAVEDLHRNGNDILPPTFNIPF